MDNTKLWRYYDLIKFLTFVNGELYFARADVFEDKYEGALLKQNADERKKKAAISCWHINDGESAAMWEVYSKAGLGIAVCTTLEKLSRICRPDDLEMEMFKVEYIDFERKFNSEDYKHYELLPFKNKRKEFEYEHEFRIMLYQIKHGTRLPSNGDVLLSQLDELPPEGIKISINSSDLINEIIAAPHMKKYEVSEIRRLLDLINSQKGTNFTIRQSKLYENLE